jgi:hypothetical protein
MVRSGREVKVYVEGGAIDSDFLRARCREGFRKFVEAAGIRGVTFVARGGRTSAHDTFCTALAKRAPDDIILLLVDSEEPLTPGADGWTHLESRPNNRLKKPEKATEEHLFLMVQCMETWFLADLDRLEEYFGPEFNRSVFKQWPDLEAVPKPDVLAALVRASKRLDKKARGYAELSFDVLATLRPDEVASRCPDAKRLLGRLRSHTTWAARSQGT